MIGHSRLVHFQIVDLRWGCHGEIPCYNQDQTMGTTVLEECLQMSQGPNFVVSRKNICYYMYVTNSRRKNKYDNEQYICIIFSQTLIGQKYGHRTLPYSIPAEDFDIMKETLHNHPSRATRDIHLMDVWYKCDTNAVPPRYVLIDPTSVPEQYRVRSNIYMPIFNIRSSQKRGKSHLTISDAYSMIDRYIKFLSAGR